MNYEEMEKMMEELMQDPQYQQLFMWTMLITLAVMAVIWLVTYILGAIGTRRLGLRAGITHATLAYLPVLRWVILGKLAELRLPQEKKDRKSFAYSMHLPVLMTLSFLLQAVWTVPYVYYEFILTDGEMPARMLGWMNGISMAYQVISIIGMVMLLMAVTRIFTMTQCSSPTLMALLCAVVSYCLPILLFVCRNRPFIKGPRHDENSPDDQPPHAQ